MKFYILAALPLVGCQYFSDWNQRADEYSKKRMTDLVASQPEEPPSTPAEDLFRVQDIVTEVSSLFEVDPPPELRIVERRNNILGGGQAIAVLFSSGLRALYVSRAEVVSGFNIRPTIEHEMSHFRAWDEYGPDISDHGSKWKRVCRSIATEEEACDE